MSFIADKQTLEDLNLLGKFKQNSIFSLFNVMHTRGGERLMESMFLHPLTDAETINKRSVLFQYFQQKGLVFPIGQEEFIVVEEYLETEGERNIVAAGLNILMKKFLSDTVKDERYCQLRSGITNTIRVFQLLNGFMQQLDSSGPYAKQLAILKDILNNKELAHLSKNQGPEEIPILKLARYDYLLRYVMRERMITFLELVHELDLLLAVSKVSSVNGFAYAEALSKDDSNVLEVNDFWHPRLKSGVANSLYLSGDTNVLFLTGANMAGKSTLMKSFGTNFYLAHMGFPVAAKRMLFSVKDGLFSSINVSDNLDLGISHFYAEVLRVKMVAEAVRDDKDLLVIFDELFKGTNVKDAYDATLAVTAAFAENRNCFFVISTHIIEVGKTLKEQSTNLQFSFLPTLMRGTIPHYPYILHEGITSDQHGMLIIENEGILDLMREAASKLNN